MIEVSIELGERTHEVLRCSVRVDRFYVRLASRWIALVSASFCAGGRNEARTAFSAQRTISRGGQVERGRGGAVVLADVAAEVRGIVAVDRDARRPRAAACAKLCSRRSLTTHSLRFDSGHTVSGICFAHEPLDERGILVAAHAVIDALDARADRAPRGCTRPGLPRRRGRPCAGRARAPARTRARTCSADCRARRSRARRRRIRARNGSAGSSVANASSSERWRRKHRISSRRDAVALVRVVPSRRAGRRSRPPSGCRARCGSADRRTARRGRRCRRARA